MTSPRSLDDRLFTWVQEETSGSLPDRVLDDTFTHTRAIRQASRPTWRSLKMPRLMPAFFTAGAAVIVLALGAWLLLPRNGGIGGPTTSPSPTPSARPGPSGSPISSLTGSIVYLKRDAADHDFGFVTSADGTHERSLFDQALCCLVLSPDGTRVLAGYSNNGKTWTTVVDVATNAAVDGGLWQPSDKIDLTPYAWSKGDNLAFTGTDRATGAPAGLWLSINKGGGSLLGELRLLDPGRPAAEDIPVAFSPDGSRLLYLRDRGNGRQSPDGQTPTFELYASDLDASNQVKLNPDGEGMNGYPFDDGASRPQVAAWSPDGTHVAFKGYSQTIYVADATRGAPIAVAGPNPGSSSFGVAWSPDGNWIAYDQSDPAPRDLFIVSPDGANRRQLSSPAGLALWQATWSPDSQYLLVLGSTAEFAKSGLYRMALDTGESFQVAAEVGLPSGGLPYSRWAWSPVAKAGP